MQSAAGSNTALFRRELLDETYLPAFQDAPRAPPRIPRPQPVRRRTGSAARAPRARPQEAFGL